MTLSNNRVAVRRAKQPVQEGFKTVEPTDDFVYKGEVVQLSGDAVFLSSRALQVGDTVLFAKYSPDTQEMEHDGERLKFVILQDLIAVL